jgi:hypothetical protein
MTNTRREMICMTYDGGEPCLLRLPNQLNPDLDLLYQKFLDLIESSSKDLAFEGYPTNRETLAFLKSLDDTMEWWPLVPSLTEMADQAARANDSRFVGNFHDG